MLFLLEESWQIYGKKYSAANRFHPLNFSKMENLWKNRSEQIERFLNIRKIYTRKKFPNRPRFLLEIYFYLFLPRKEINIKLSSKIILSYTYIDRIVHKLGRDIVEKKTLKRNLIVFSRTFIIFVRGYASSFPILRPQFLSVLGFYLSL